VEGFFSPPGAGWRVFVITTLCNFSILQKAFFVEKSGNTGNSSGNMKGTITVKEAAELTGACVWTIKQHIYKGSFSACKPLGNRGGWRIFTQSFNQWWAGRIGETSNKRPAK
jgi:excisionase family DNA binding protein